MAKTRKPPGAKESWALPSWVLKCGAGVLILAVIIGISHLLSPSDTDADGAAVPIPSQTPGKVTAVTALDDDSFDKFLEANPEGALVDFYSTGCKFCTKLAPEFEEAAKKLRASGGPPLASIEAQAGPNMMKKYGIERYPTVLWFNKGENVLELPRASEKPAAKIVEWAQWALTPAVQELETRAEFDEAVTALRSSLHAKARLLVAFNREGHEGIRTAFEAAAQRHRSTSVFLFIKESSSDDVMLKAYAPNESDDQQYQGSATKEEVVEWVKAIVAKPKEKSEAPDKTAEEEKADDNADQAES